MIKNRINPWAVLGALWFAAILLTGYHVSKIHQLHAALDEKETLRLDRQFWQRHAADLEKLVIEGDRLYLTMDSMDMGLLTVEHRLKTISAQLGLPPVTLSRQQGNETNGEAPLGILFAGDFNQVFLLLQAVKKEMPFLRAKNIGINVDADTRKVVLQGSYILRYKIEPGTDEPQTPGST